MCENTHLEVKKRTVQLKEIIHFIITEFQSCILCVEILNMAITEKFDDLI